MNNEDLFRELDSLKTPEVKRERKSNPMTQLKKLNDYHWVITSGNLPYLLDGNDEIPISQKILNQKVTFSNHVIELNDLPMPITGKMTIQQFLLYVTNFLNSSLDIHNQKIVKEVYCLIGYEENSKERFSIVNSFESGNLKARTFLGDHIYFEGFTKGKGNRISMSLGS